MCGAIDALLKLGRAADSGKGRLGIQDKDCAEACLDRSIQPAERLGLVSFRRRNGSQPETRAARSVSEFLSAFIRALRRGVIFGS